MRHLVPLGVLKQLLAGQHGWLILPQGVAAAWEGLACTCLPASSAHGGGSSMNIFAQRGGSCTNNVAHGVEVARIIFRSDFAAVNSRCICGRDDCDML